MESYSLRKLFISSYKIRSYKTFHIENEATVDLFEDL